jgi:hypothetical protein
MSAIHAAAPDDAAILSLCAPRCGMEALFLRLFRRLGPREQRTWLDAMIRVLDGQPFEDAFVEALVELGDPLGVAQQIVRSAVVENIDWRQKLN